MSRRMELKYRKQYISFNFLCALWRNEKLVLIVFLNGFNE